MNSTTKLVHIVGAGKIKSMRQIGPILQIDRSEPLTMQAAYDTDCETGVRWMNEEKSKELHAKFPTICAMAELIEKERDKYKRQADRLKKLISQLPVPNQKGQ